MTSKRICIVLCSLGLFVVARPGLSFEVKTYQGLDCKWFDSTYRYYIDSDGSSHCTGEFDAVRAGANAWDVASGLFAVDLGVLDLDPTQWGDDDGMNIHVWCESDWGTVTGYPTSGVVAVNYWRIRPTGEVVDTDIIYNAEAYQWSTAPGGEPGKMDVQNLATHEIGHSMMLKDLYELADAEKTMYGYVDNGEIKKRTLHQDDIDGVVYLYGTPVDTSTPTLTPTNTPVPPTPTPVENSVGESVWQNYD